METEISEETLLSNSLDNFILDNYENTLTQLNSLISKSEWDSKREEDECWILQEDSWPLAKQSAIDSRFSQKSKSETWWWLDRWQRDRVIRWWTEADHRKLVSMKRLLLIALLLVAGCKSNNKFVEGTSV